ncbi:MAG TPA: YetF domain-containing protein [Kofleriaceae bacterium]|nr:YetF domain-containing protein [Kofleriaceae bacterium]
MFGTGKELDALQMGMRAFVLFFITLLLIRVAGRRSFGRKSAFDTIIVIMLGAVLSRAVTGASPFWPTLVAGGVLVLIHRVLGILSSRSQRFDHVLKGGALVLYREGRIDWHAMRRAGASVSDLDEAARRQTNKRDHTEVAQIVMESSGELSVVEHAPPPDRRQVLSRTS